MRTRREIASFMLSTMGALGLLPTLPGCGPWEDEPPAETEPGGDLGTAEEPLVFGLFPDANLPVIVGSPFPGGAAGLGTWFWSTGPDADALVCRECTYTNGQNLGPDVDNHKYQNAFSVPVLTPPAPYPATLAPSLSPVAIDATILAFAATLFDHGVSATGAPRGLAHLVFESWSSYAKPMLAVDGLSGVNDALEVIEDAVDLINDWLPDDYEPKPSVNVSLFTEQPWAIPYKPINARFKGAEWKQEGGAKVATERLYHPNPFALHETRFRGARSYCAMRQAAAVQQATGAYSMGERDVGGSWWEFSLGRVKPTFKVGEAVDLQDSTGANAFAIPMAVGSKVSPLVGPIFPQMPEVVTPVVWITGDAEVISQEDYGLIPIDKLGDFILLMPGYRKIFLDAQHVDLFVGKATHGGIDVAVDKIPIWGGVVTADVDLSLRLMAGMPVHGFSDASNAAERYSELGDGRLLDYDECIPLGHICVSTYPPPRHPHPDRLEAGHFRPWTAGSTRLATDAPAEPFLGFASYSSRLRPVEDDGPLTQWMVPQGLGLRVRAVNDDDRSIVLLNETTEALGLTVNFGASVGPLSITFSGSSSIWMRTMQLTTLREQVSIVDGANFAPVPLGGRSLFAQTNFVAMTEAKHRGLGKPFDVGVHFHLALSDILPFVDDIDWDHTFLKLPAISINDDARWDEASRLRAGIYSDIGNDIDLGGLPEFRSVYSHVPDPGANGSPPASFVSWPSDSNTVPSCLAEPAPEIELPPPEKGETGSPSGDVCIYGLTRPELRELPGFPKIDWNIPGGICAVSADGSFVGIDSYLAQVTLASPQVQCLRHMLTFLCSGSPSLVQVWGQLGNVIARPFELSLPGAPASADEAELTGIIEQCAIAFGNPEAADPTAELQIVFQHLFQYGACDETTAALQGSPPAF